jgi:quinol monooxygenase YgiN
MIYVIATVEVEAGKREEFLAAFRENVPNVIAEAGCIEYVPTVDHPTKLDAQPALRDDVVTVVEKWEDLDALNAHLAAPHMLSYRQQVGHLVKSVELQVLEPA